MSGNCTSRIAPHRCARTILLLAILGLGVTASGEEPRWTSRPIPPQPGQDSTDRTLWYRCHLVVAERLVKPAATARDLWRNSMMLALSDLPGPFELFLNGTSIARADGIPLGEERRLKVPKGLLQSGVGNTLVLRLEGESASRGLTSPPVFLDYFNELVLDRPWEVSRSRPTAEDLAPGPVGAKTYRPEDFKLSSRALSTTHQPFPGKRVPPAEAHALLETDEDLAVDAVLSEPAVAQPTHFSFDGRGRLWIAQYRQYPYPAGLRMISRDQYYRSRYDRTPPPPPHHDRGADLVSVHEDRDGDGVYESGKRVLEGLNMANAVVHGWGGLWVMHTPYLLFYPDRDGDDQPDGPPEVRLAGFGLEDTHSVANGLAWGPDGWLYGVQGSTTIARVNRPGIDPPDAPGQYNEGCHVWRYHPRSRDFELFADGGGNNFGLAFDAEGRLFTGHNGGNTRGWHLIQGARFLKQGRNAGKFGPAPNPYDFGELPMMASSNPIPRFSHMTIVAEGSALPGRLRGRFLSIDPLHHHAIAATRHPVGSTFRTSDLGNPLRTMDRTFRPVFLANSPCGGVMIADFREEFIAHGQNYQGQIDPTTGRLYRLRATDRPLIRKRDLASLESSALLDILGHDNPWHRHTAARLLGERADPSVAQPLRAMLEQPSLHPALDALWALHQADHLQSGDFQNAFRHPAPMVRAWALRLAGDKRQLDSDLLAKACTMAAGEGDAEVRCQVLSTARRLPPQQSLALVQSLASVPSDRDDPYIPLMTWFALEALCANDRDALLAMLGAPEFWQRPVIAQHIVPRLMRRFAEAGTRRDFLTCARLLELAPDDQARTTLLGGFEKAFEGRSLPPLPPELAHHLGNQASLSLRIRRGEPESVATGLALLASPTGAPERRLAAAHALATTRNEDARATFLSLTTGELAGSPELRRTALHSLQQFDDEDLARELARTYPALPAPLQPVALGVLATRSSWARVLASCVEDGTIPSAHLDDSVRARLALHGDEQVDRLLATLPANAETTPGDTILAILAEGPGDPYRGEVHYEARCASCHRLFFKGGSIGPDLTRYQRDDLTTLLPSILQPDAEIREGYENMVLTTTDGRVLNGFLSDHDANTVVLRGFAGSDHTIPRSEIKKLAPVGRSLMPAGLLHGLSETELRDFFAYLRIPQPISR